MPLDAVLLVEDEAHKVNDLIGRLRAHGVADSAVCTVSSVRDAVLQVMSRTFDLIVLDMALPTFTKSSAAGGSGGIAQPVGGIEVLRALKSKGERCPIVIVTQYPEVLINGVSVRLNHLPKVIARHYQQNLLGAILYAYKQPGWQQDFDHLIRRVL